MFKRKMIAGLCTLTIVCFTLAGCGEKTVTTATGPSKLEASKVCFDSGCHASSTSKVTGLIIADEWQLSKHQSSNGAGCIDCHFLDATDAQPHMDRVCGRCHAGTPVTTTHNGLPPNAIRNPDSYGICGKCHTSTSGFNITSYDSVSVNTSNTHFKNFTSATISRTYSGLYYSNYSTYVITKASNATANWASSYYKPVTGDSSKYGCRGCHNPHNTSSKIDILRQWSRSGHGDPNAAPRTSYDFKTMGSTATASTTMGSICVRCHTSTGYINYIKSDYSTVTALAASGTADHTKEVTGCNVCHDDGNGNAYAYSVRNVISGRTGVPAYFNYSAARGGNVGAGTRVNYSFTFTDAKSSNICVVCHMGREAGQVIKLAYAQGVDFANTARVSAHDFAAGANLYQESGFEFYTDPAKYPTTSFLHYKVGINNEQGTGTKGPCITCHMSSSTSHTFMPITKTLDGSITSITSTACAKCHTIPAVTNNKTMASAGDLEQYRLGFKSAMTVLRDEIVKKFATVKIGSTASITLKTNGTLTYGVSVTNSSTGKKETVPPNWIKACDATATTMAQDTIVVGSGNPSGGAGDKVGKGAYTMGAAFNYELLYADYGSYVHNPNYVKRLIFDSIDWLQDCALSTSAGDETAVCNYINSIDPAAKSYLCPNNVRP